MKENQRNSLFVWLAEVFMKSSLTGKASKKKIWEFWDDKHLRTMELVHSFQRNVNTKLILQHEALRVTDTGKTQRDGMGKEVGGGFRMGDTCTPMADSCQFMAKKKKNYNFVK